MKCSYSSLIKSEILIYIYAMMCLPGREYATKLFICNMRIIRCPVSAVDHNVPSSGKKGSLISEIVLSSILTSC